ncbi:MAG: hypothetical protein E7534_00120 [Ruminococcaceae bacterium]|nr:hypothetical protein [Oscillospiraceae bacterium]
MAVFFNQATLTYNGVSTNSNIAVGEILDALTATKTAVEGVYTVGELITYAVALRNTTGGVLADLTVSDDLGGYAFGGGTVYPLTYEDGSALLFIDGAVQPAPAVVAGPPAVFTGITIPANGDAVLVYQARANGFAPPVADGTIVNTVTVTGDGLSAPVTATETVTADAAARLTISKSITPTQVVDNDRVTYTFVIQNFGNEAVVATDDAIVTDTFDPILTDLVVTFNGEGWVEGVQYTYDEATGQFASAAGQITVPAATFTQDPVTGAYTTVPGTATLVVVGTI